MPELESYFHYRYLDVSTLKELARRWKPEILDGFKSRGRIRRWTISESPWRSFLTTAKTLLSCDFEIRRLAWPGFVVKLCSLPIK